jgi:hypothetical protein
LNIATRLSAISIRQSPIGNRFSAPDAARGGGLSGIWASRENMEATFRRKLLEDTFPAVLPASDFLAFISVARNSAAHYQLSTPWTTEM